MQLEKGNGKGVNELDSRAAETNKGFNKMNEQQQT